jgi:threonine/homoserine/homoserine lactone efflux protein
MLELSRLPVFLFASLILLLTPGPAVLYIVARSLDQGRLAGLVSVASIEIGNSFHVIAAALGVSALLMSSALAFSAVKYLGAAYLVYLGLRKLFSRAGRQAQPAEAQPAEAQPAGAQSAVTVERQRLRTIFSQGVVVATFNPKTALFFLAFLPQFVDRSRGPVAVQMLALGCIFVTMAIVSDGMYALLAGSVGQWLKSTRTFLWAERYIAGSIYIGLGVTAALADAGKH